MFGRLPPVSFLIKILSLTDRVIPSITVMLPPEIVKVAPTPAVPLLYVTVPPDMVATVPVDATRQGACTANPCATSSTYCLVAASVDAVGVAKSVIRFELTATVPVPVGASVIG